MIGRWLDTLSDEQRDRVITADLAPGDTVYDDGSRCVLGAAGNYRWICGIQTPMDREPERLMASMERVVGGLPRFVYRRFDKGCYRWDESFVRAVKMRAANPKGRCAERPELLIAQAVAPEAISPVAQRVEQPPYTRKVPSSSLGGRIKGACSSIG